MNPEQYMGDIVPIEGRPFEHDLALFDEFGLLLLRCHSCGKQIGGRTYAEVRSRVDVNKTEKAMIFIRYANYAEKEVKMSDGSLARVKICIDCTDIPIHLDKVTIQMKRAWMKENIHAGHSLEKLSAHHSLVQPLKAIQDTGKIHLPWKRSNPNAGR